MENIVFLMCGKDKEIFKTQAKYLYKRYDKSIYDMSIIEKDEWAKMVISKLKAKVDIDNNNFIFLTDDYYNEYLYKYLSHSELPLKGINQNEHLSWFLKMLNEKGE